MLIGCSQAKDGKRMLIIGLSEENVQELKKGRPIYKRAGEPLEFHLVVEFAATELALVQKLAAAGLDVAQAAQQEIEAARAKSSDPDPRGN